MTFVIWYINQIRSMIQTIYISALRFFMRYLCQIILFRGIVVDWRSGTWRDIPNGINPTLSVYEPTRIWAIERAKVFFRWRIRAFQNGNMSRYIAYMHNWFFMSLSSSRFPPPPPQIKRVKTSNLVGDSRITCPRMYTIGKQNKPWTNKFAPKKE